MNEIDSLQEQLDLNRKKLKELDESIKKLNGNERNNFDDENRSGRSRQNDRKRKLENRNNSDRYVDEEEEDDETNVKKPTLQSSVVTKSINVIKSKEDLIKIQNKDTGSQQRNKRMLGFILGTLKQFKTEDREHSNTEQAQHRKELERKIEVKKQEEKLKMVEEKKQLEIEKNKKLRSIEIIETKIHLTETFDLWKRNHLKLKNFIRTKTKPFIFYLPKNLDEKSERLLDESCKKIDDEYNDKKNRIEKELKALNEEAEALNADSLDIEKSDLSEEKENEIKKDVQEQMQDEVDDLEEADKSNNVRLGEDIEDEEQQSSPDSSSKKKDTEDVQAV
ncbi:unnamed protein product [Brachionus calyciflorus]|uniref:Pinin/SDK/MemA protein domain-containing protein n=1 Tax=Brachionus calyciflorus TaxID=104777 RepID=A0A813UNU8_9BILA|nr:unnamed protein product [Brachionus calyciflorus]